jgi:hypothetical protein
MKFKIFLLLLLIALGILAYFGYPIIKNRYFKSANQSQSDQKDGASTVVDKKEIENSNNDSKTESPADTQATEEEAKSETDESGDASNITAKDCDNECASFQENSNDLKYCQDICDISPIKDADNCDSKQGSDKDYCFKNQAIAKTDLKICNSIADAKIKTSCKSRVTEDLLESN